MALTYQQVIDKAEIILQDESSDQTERRWTETELLGWAKEGENEIVRIKPDVNPIIEAVKLTAGSQQSLPSRALQLLDVLCNMGTDGTTRGDIVSVVERKWMNAVDPGWMKATASNTSVHVIYDPERAPKLFWVYPMSTGNNYLEIMTSKLYDNSSAVIGSNISVPDEFNIALMNFICAMAFAKDTDIAESVQRAQLHLSAFAQALGVRDASEINLNAKRTLEKN